MWDLGYVGTAYLAAPEGEQHEQQSTLRHSSLKRMTPGTAFLGSSPMGDREKRDEPVSDAVVRPRITCRGKCPK